MLSTSDVFNTIALKIQTNDHIDIWYMHVATINRCMVHTINNATQVT